MYKVRELAKIAGVSIRTLHYYDEIDLLKPSQKSKSGYRIYDNGNLEKLQQILFFREMNFSLHKIKQILYDPYFDKKKELSIQKEVVLQKKNKLEKILYAMEKVISSTVEVDLYTVFKEFDMQEIISHKEKYNDEIEKKWGKTPGFAQCKKKTSEYSAEDWSTIQQEQNEIYQEIVKNMDKGIDADKVGRALEKLRQNFCRYFYDCTPIIFIGLADMYIADPRFAGFYENIKTGLSQFMHDSIHFHYSDLQ